MKKFMKALVLVLALSLVLAGCQYLPGPQQGHTHTLVHFEEKAPTCTEGGILEHWYCPDCNTRFTDEAATTEALITDMLIDKLPHTPGEDDGDCTTAIPCTVCGKAAVAGKAHTPEADDGDCTTNTMCSVCAKVAIPAPGHTGLEDYKCDACKQVFLPAEGTPLTIPQALAIAQIGGSDYTTAMYYITGTVSGLYDTVYGNFYLKDADGNEILVYGLYNADGTVRYDAMETKPVNGDIITIHTVLGAYIKGEDVSLQAKDARLEVHTPHDHTYTSVVTDPTCTAGGYTTHTCSICDATVKDTETDALGHTTANGTCERCGLEIGGGAEFGTIVKYEFGANGDAAVGHKDGNGLGATTSYTEGAYTLDLTGMSKVYGPAYDAKGNSCIKLGSSSDVGTLTFAVPEDVTEVTIYVAMYKAKTTKVTVNGTEHVISTLSDNGEYTAITVDTTTVKEITIATVSGACRCMINAIEFKGMVIN